MNQLHHRKAKPRLPYLVTWLVIFVQITAASGVGVLTAVQPTPPLAQRAAADRGLGQGIAQAAGWLAQQTQSLFGAPKTALAQTSGVPPIPWQKTIGGSGDDTLSSVQQTSDGGYILGGMSRSGISGDKSEASRGGYDYWVVKLDSSGNKQWDKTYGSSSDDRLGNVRQTSDGGYIVGGVSRGLISGDKTAANLGLDDYWVVKLDSSGNKLWDKTYGGSADDELISLQQTSDGGYILGGYSASDISGNKTAANLGLDDYWVVKLDASGNKLWDKTYGGSTGDELRSIEQTSDGGYILGGDSLSGISGNKTTANLGGYDYWVVKLDSGGNKLWDKTYGGSLNDELRSVRQTSDGGYILGGFSLSGVSGNKTAANLGGSLYGDAWVVKLDSSGNKLWDKTYGGSGDESMLSVEQTSDGDYILGGFSTSGVSGNKIEANLGNYDYWLLKLDGSGNIVWQDDIGGDGFDSLTSLQQTSDGNYILGGFSDSDISGDKSAASKGSADYWVVRLVPVDQGDAPDSYGTRYLSNGPRHTVIPGLRMGARVDAEPDIVPSAAANADDTQTGIPANDEDGVASFPLLTTGNTSYSLNVTVVNATGVPANLIGWIDFNRNGTFQASEATSVSVPNGATSATLTWSGLSGLVAGQSYVRLRLTTDPSITTSTPGGYAINGEVEDHALTIAVGVPDLTTSIGQPVPSLVVGQPSNVPLTFNNSGTGPTTGTVTASMTLPTGTSAPASFTSGPWTCSTSGQTVTCTQPGPLAAGGSSTIQVPVTPSAATLGTQPGPFTGSASTPGETNTANNSSTMTPTTPVAASTVSVPLKVFLDGPIPKNPLPNPILMNDNLRAANLLPTSSPYASAPATAAASVFAVSGNNAIVDWVLVEVRNPVAPATVLARQAAFVQRDGDVVALDGVSPLTISGVSAGNYYVAVKHRNHLGVMTASPVSLAVSGTALLDFTNPATPVYGTNAQRLLSGKAMLWAGNANQDKFVIGVGPNNDQNSMLSAVLGAAGNPTNNRNYIVTGYAATDVNLDGLTIVTGPNNDGSVVLVTVLLYPGNTAYAANYSVPEQVP